MTPSGYRICSSEPSIIRYWVNPPLFDERTLAAEKYATPGCEAACLAKTLFTCFGKPPGTVEPGPIGGSPTHMTRAPAVVASSITSATRAE